MHKAYYLKFIRISAQGTMLKIFKAYEQRSQGWVPKMTQVRESFSQS